MNDAATSHTLPSSLPFDVNALGQECAVADVPKRLRDLWAGEQAGTKASLINFAIYSEDPGALPENTRLLSAVTRNHACRALLLGVAKNGQNTTVRSWITAHCQLTSAGVKSVCSEQISFLLQGEVTDALRNVLFANLESDLPLVFWWQGELSNGFEPHLYRRIDRLVLDSASWQQPAENASRLRHAVRDHHSHFVILDLAGMRIFPYRLALAGVFDEAPVRAHWLGLSEIEMDHAPDQRMTALLLLGWMAVKLGGSLSRNGDEAMTLRRVDGSEVSVRLNERSGSAPLARVVLRGPQLEVEIARQAGGKFLHTEWRAGDGRGSQVTPALSDDAADLVTQRLSRGGNNALYFRILSVLQAVLGGEEAE